MPIFVSVYAYVRFRSCLCSPVFMPIFFEKGKIKPVCP